MDEVNTSTLFSSPLVKKALKYATKAHLGTMRKDGTEPYINHPIRVATITEDTLHNETATTVALLHDVVEDTTLTFNYITEKFGSDVTRLIQFLTEKYANEDYEERKYRLINQLTHAPREVVCIKIADQIDNMESILRSKNNNCKNPWSIFKHGKQSKIDQWEYSFDLFSKQDDFKELLIRYRVALNKLISIPEK
ncbi:phosphohydrolase [candidate division WWE3 bacterium CG_4_9_14_3_um_filter_39_7]|uniref:Phosphohydrolase n=1 Tax=candidate division WWE3 bacterium CG_4_9_14_3_um_filter_39_7 TaxID=1975080 RepID=A0A2M7X059_UNCKA|nr:MAG: phosphohydrolase [candidate division WWE3 bacterium CG_4_9_14_3_um_filter_39_7]